jgi:hypothetical protein
MDVREKKEILSYLVRRKRAIPYGYGTCNVALRTLSVHVSKERPSRNLGSCSSPLRRETNHASTLTRKPHGTFLRFKRLRPARRCLTPPWLQIHHPDNTRVIRHDSSLLFDTNENPDKWLGILALSHQTAHESLVPCTSNLWRGMWSNAFENSE